MSGKTVSIPAEATPAPKGALSQGRTPTPWELRQLESAPKSKSRASADRVICGLPIVMAALVIAQYKLAPNVGNAITTDTYTYFILFMAFLVSVKFIMSCFSKTSYEKLLAKAPLYTAGFLLFALYDYATLKSGILPLPYFPWPDRILNGIYEDRALLLDCIKNSLILLFSGYFAGVFAGLLTGLASGLSSRVRYWVMPLIQILGPIPSTTWLPIILIVASSLFGGSVFLIALGVWYPVTMTSMLGVLNIPKANFEAARTLGAGKTRLVFKVALPATMPHIFQGLTQGMSVACTALMVAEMMGVESGLGWYINWQRGWAEFAKMYGAVIVICVTFSIVNFLLSLVKRRVLRWQEVNWN
ncbi:MAG: ABC transporter permease subunit [Synergistaceae bacterium]|jgi:NitT/TauT family transport system permease protein|nr:ABC transporter permease subunit [Synergistaceae bacterium]